MIYDRRKEREGEKSYKSTFGGIYHSDMIPMSPKKERQENIVVRPNFNFRSLLTVPQASPAIQAKTEETPATETVKEEVTVNEPIVQEKSEDQPNRTGLPDDLKAGIENLSGYSLDEVRVHYNSPKPAQLQALAYTQGTDIHVASGQEEHLPHEAWHVVQQMQGRVKPTMQMKGVQINDDEGLEREADVMGVKAWQIAPANLTKTGLEKSSDHEYFRKGSLSSLGSEQANASPVPEQLKGLENGLHHNGSAVVSPDQGKNLPIQTHGQPIQLMMSKGQFQGETGRYYNLSNWWNQDPIFTQIDTALSSYGSIRGNNSLQTVVHRKMALLSEIEHLVYKWFNKNKSNLDNEPNQYISNGMRKLMDSVQREHILLTQAMVTHNHELWLPTGTSQRQTKLAQQLWRRLRDSSGNIKIRTEAVEYQNDSTVAPPPGPLTDFQVKTLSSFARLLTGQVGRRLIKKLQHGEKQVYIHPMHEAEYQGKPGNAITVPTDDPTNLVGYATNALAQQNGPNAFTKRTGLDSRLRMDPTAYDSQTADLDAAGNRIAAPHFITLGHELIHAYHNMTGQNLEHVTSDAFTGAGGDAIWKDMEEWATIQGRGNKHEITENALRAEHGLTARHSHQGGKNWKYSIKVYSFWSSIVDPIGHAFVEVITPDRKVVAGFSPQNIPTGSSLAPQRIRGESALVLGVPGVVNDEMESLNKQNLTTREFNLTPAQANAAIHKIETDKTLNLTYQTFGLNCSTWAADVLHVAGQSLPLSWFAKRTPLTMWATSLSQERIY